MVKKKSGKKQRAYYETTGNFRAQGWFTFSVKNLIVSQTPLKVLGFFCCTGCAACVQIVPSGSFGALMETHGDTISMTVDGYGLGYALVFASGPYYHLMGVPHIILIHSELFLDN